MDFPLTAQKDGKEEGSGSHWLKLGLRLEWPDSPAFSRLSRL
jgi:hypothetical protein